MLHTQALINNRDFQRMYSKGKSQAHPLLVLYVMRNRLGYTRMGITCSKKVGNAVKRNRAKRIIRAAYRHAEPQLECGYDVVLVARTRTTTAKSTELIPVLLRQAAKLGIIAGKAEK